MDFFLVQFSLLLHVCEKVLLCGRNQIQLIANAKDHQVWLLKQEKSEMYCIAITFNDANYVVVFVSGMLKCVIQIDIFGVCVLSLCEHFVPIVQAHH